MPGVYLIRCRVSGLKYVGGTKHGFEERFAWHITALRCGKAARKLQACYDLYGPDNLDFIPLKEFPADEVHEREREAIADLKPELNIYGVIARSGAPVTKYQVGDRQLTVTEIAAEAGVHEDTIRARIARGLTDTALIRGKHAAPRKPYVRRR